MPSEKPHWSLVIAHCSLLIAGLLCGCAATAPQPDWSGPPPLPDAYEPTNGYYQQTLELRLPYVTYETNSLR